MLVIRGGAIGDFILTLPVFAALRSHFPETHLQVLGYPHIAHLAQAGGLVDAVRSIDARPMASFFARNGELEGNLREYFSRFSVILSYLYDPDIIFQTNVALSSHAQFIQCPHRPDEQQRVHATDVFLKPLEQLTIYGADPIPRLTFPAMANGSFPAGCWLALHPGSGSERKNWPERKWVELAEKLIANTDCNLLLVAGEAEGDRLDRMTASLPPGRIKCAQRLPLSELGQWLTQCKAFVGHDSGISHLAAAVALPGVLLWGDTSEAIWRPKNDKMILIREPKGLAALPVSQVFTQVNALLERL